MGKGRGRKGVGVEVDGMWVYVDYEWIMSGLCVDYVDVWMDG